MNKIEMVKEAVRLLLEASPVTGHLELQIWRCGDAPQVTVYTASPSDYQEATEWVRSWGCGTRRKEIQGGVQTCVMGEIDGVVFKAIGAGLPPTCRVEKYTERVPKVETVDTGEFIEMERTRVVCAEGESTGTRGDERG